MISLSAISHLVTILRVWLLHSAILYNILVCFINEETIPQSNITMITYKELGYRTTIVWKCNFNKALRPNWTRTFQLSRKHHSYNHKGEIGKTITIRLLQNYYYKCIIRNNIDIVPKDCITIETNIAKESRISYYQWNNDAEK